MTRRLLPVCVLALSAIAQTPPTFDVVSIKPHPLPPGQFFFRMPGGEFRATGPTFSARTTTLEYLIMDAYNVKDYQIAGLPGWGKGANADHFDFDAKCETTPTTAQLRQMLQVALADRFQLKIRHDKKEYPVYSLTVAPGGVKMRKLGEDEKVPTYASMPPASAKSIGGWPGLLNLISMSVDRPVIDETHLNGNYESVRLEWQQYGREMREGSPLSIFADIQPQLGLKLTPRKDLVDIVVVESAQKPSAN